MDFMFDFGHLFTLADSISKLTLADVAHCWSGRGAEERQGTW